MVRSSYRRHSAQSEAQRGCTELFMSMSCRDVITLRFVTGTHKYIGRYSTLTPRPSSYTGEFGPWSEMMFCSTVSTLKATCCFSQLGIGQGIGSCSKTMLQLTKPRTTWHALLQMLQEDISWTGFQILLFPIENLWACLCFAALRLQGCCA